MGVVYKWKKYFTDVVCNRQMTNLTLKYHIPSYSFHGNYSFLNLEIQRLQYREVTQKIKRKTLALGTSTFDVY